MADNLIFPIKFDLEGGVKEALKDGDKALKKIEESLAKNHIIVKMRLDQQNRLSEQVKSESQKAASDLKGLKKEMAELNRQWNTLTAAERSGTEGAALREKFRALRQEAQGYTSTLQAAVKAEDKLRNAQDKTAASTRSLGEEYQNTSTYIKNLLTKTAVLWSFHQVSSFLVSLREVTAEFELQRVSLGAIIQDQQRANQLFAEIKNFALQSPVKLLDLTKYTKQVAAYGIETEKLFDTTKMLADISVGLGVGMDRLTLFFGQVYATGYLRASEVRQATEAGIPLVDKLAKKLSDANGKLVSAAEVMDLISKRAISFEMVEEVFKDMTSEGGEFYNMQIKQGQTLFGMWAKLGDAAAIMYDEIGNTESVNYILKGLINTVTELMRNWRTMANVAISASAAIVAYTLAMKNASIAAKALSVADAQSLAIEKAKIINTPKLVQTLIGKNNAVALSVQLEGLYAKAAAKSYAATNLLTKGFWRLTATILANPWALLTAGLFAGIASLIHFGEEEESLQDKTNRLSRETDELIESLNRTNTTVIDQIDKYEELSNKVDKTAEEKEDLIKISNTLADQFPASIIGLNEETKAWEINTAAIIENNKERRREKIDALEVQEKEARGHLENLKNEKQRFKTELRGLIRALNILNEGRRRLDDVASNAVSDSFAGGTLRHRAVKNQYGVYTIDKEDVDYIKSELERKIDERKKWIDGLGEQIDQQNNKLYDILVSLDKEPKREVAAIEAEGGWKEYLQKASKTVEELRNGQPIRLFDPNTITQFKDLNEALEKTAKIYKEQKEISENYEQNLRSGNISEEIRAQIEEQKAETEVMKDLAYDTLVYFNALKLLSSKGSQSDPRLQNLKEEISLTKKLYDEYHKLEKQIGATKAAEKIQEIYSNTIKTLQDRAGKYGFKFELPFTDENLKSNMQHFIDKMKELQKLRNKKGKPLFPNIGKEIDEAVAQLEDVDLNSLQKALEEKLKVLSDRISRTKTAKEFYDKVLGMTGDYELAMHVSTVIYGSTGKELDEQIKEQFRLAFATLDKPDVEVSAKIGDLIDKGRYEELRDYINLLPKDERKAAEDLVKAQQQMSAQQYEQWIKDLDKAKTFADKRIELSRYTANQIAAIEERIAKLNPADKDYAAQKAILENMIKGYNQREEREAAKLEYDAFKDTPLYVQMFEDLEHASTSTLEHMKQKLIALKSVWGTALDPAQLKEMQSRLNEIESQLLARNPWKALKEAYRDYTKTVKEYSVSGAEANVATAQANYEAIVEGKGADSKEALAAAETLKIEQQRLDIVKQLTNEKGKQLTGQKALDKAMQIANDKEGQARVDLATAEAEYQKAIKDSGSPESEEAKAAHTVVEEKKEALNLAQATSNIVQQDAKTSKTLKESMAAAAQGVVAGLHAAGDIASGIAKVTETLGGDELDVQYWNDIADGLNEIGDGIENVVQAAISGNPMAIVSSVINLIPSMISGFSKVFNADKIRKANKEIRRQQELLDQLEYTYDRLGKAAEQALGTDYIENYNQRIKNLQAQAAAYQAQAAAERSKGKDADKDKIKEYEDAARDTMDEIADMQNELVEKIMGTDVASAARDFATAWLEAKASFANTADAIKDKYKELVKNMIVETMASKVMQSILQPLFDNIDALLKKEDIDGAVDYLITGMDEFIEKADNGMNVLYNKLLARGYDMQSLLGDTEDLTGISRNIATASEESINGLAAGINTQNYYISYVPTISENVAAIRQLMERGTTATIPEAAASGWTDWQQQAMDNYLAIQRNTADTVVECRRAANACEEAVAKMNRIIKVKGATQGINVFLNS